MKLLLNESDKCVNLSLEELEPEKLTSSEELPRRDQRALIFHLLYDMDAFDYQTSLEFCLQFEEDV